MRSRKKMGASAAAHHFSTFSYPVPDLEVPSPQSTNAVRYCLLPASLEPGRGPRPPIIGGHAPDVTGWASCFPGGWPRGLRGMFWVTWPLWLKCFSCTRLLGLVLSHKRVERVIHVHVQSFSVFGFQRWRFSLLRALLCMAWAMMIRAIIHYARITQIRQINMPVATQATCRRSSKQPTGRHNS